ncbi:hypothetical protein AXX12_14925 [Anaerosporomusa subterranea]|uniref:4Fe-4S ferredoxin-type domain-containing protein n=1 Tax=Anaerosporomusa subterranea TaxID=1794912 RepID=A0A154BLL9_ANASB|nr:4Fe-4S binding protein [Anaerosporomusa subterranea]KYZ74873.1 hypothetical protein AXX12_14925 [Anaerosporomusa subterranea]
MNKSIDRETIIAEAKQFGAELVGIAPVSRWKEYGDLATEYHPDRVWPAAKSVIAIGMPVWLPIVDTAPSNLGRELYDTVNLLLDQVAYKLAAYLNRNGCPAISIPRDGYGDVEMLLTKPIAAFSHVWAAKYAGLGTIGWNHTLLTPQYGPRIRLVSVLSGVELEPDAVHSDDFCSRCMLCKKNCPVGAISGNEKYAHLDRIACARNGVTLRQTCRNPCNRCIKVCPIGADRKLYDSVNVSKYFDVSKVDKAQFASWKHIRSHGGRRIEGEDKEYE